MGYINEFFRNEDGSHTLEVAVITAALVALAIAFRGQLGELWGSISGKNQEYINKLKE